MELNRDDFLSNLLGEPKPLKVPRKITIDLDNRLLDRLDEVLNNLDVNKCLFGTCTSIDGTETFVPQPIKLDDGTRVIFGYYNQKDYHAFILDKDETVSERYEHPTTEVELPKKYNEYFAHCWKMIVEQSYSYAYQTGNVSKISNPNK